MSASLRHRLRPIPAVFALAWWCGGCGPPSQPMPGTFTFAAFGDAPYTIFDQPRYRRVLRQLDAADLSFVIHVGDLFWRPCSDDLFRKRLNEFRAATHPLVYVPGDNEWTDCHERIAGGYAPLERLQRLRALFFATPTMSLGASPIALTTQAADTSWAEFVEHARWTAGGIVFATVHLVGSANGRAPFSGRTPRDDSASVRRTAAADAWLSSTFALADSIDASGVVVAMHAAPGFAAPAENEYRRTFEPFMETLEVVAARFGGPVLVIHGDNHQYTVDHPLTRRTTGARLANLTRLEVMGSPDVGWVEVVVDTLAPAAARFRFAPHRVPRWQLW